MRLSIAIIAGAAALGGCAGLAPIQENVRGYSASYSDAMEAFENQEVIRNLLRAKDGLPLHFSELSQVNGSLMSQVGLQFMIPFGSSVSLSKANNTGQPSYQFSSSPSFTTSPLDTEAFQLGMLQPIQASYFISLWDEADDHAPAKLTRSRLMELFVRKIYIDDALTNSRKKGDRTCELKSPAPTRLSGKSAWLINDPADCQWQDFINDGAKTLTFRDYTVLVPLGEPFGIEAVVAGQDAKDPKPITPDQVMGLADEVSIHLGVFDATPPRRYQLFRRWDGQPGVCIDKFVKTTDHGENYTVPAMGLFSQSLSSGPGKGGQGSQNAGGSKSTGSSTAGSPAPTPTIPLIGVLDPTLCRQKEIVLGQPKSPLLTEATAAEQSASGFEVGLRSVQQVFEYLGFLLKTAEGKTIKADDKEPTIRVQRLLPGEQVKTTLQVVYGEETYVVNDENSKRVLAILHQLVNSNKLSSDIPTTKSVLIVP